MEVRLAEVRDITMQLNLLRSSPVRLALFLFSTLCSPASVSVDAEKCSKL